jgi:hypothetical protein
MSATQLATYVFILHQTFCTHHCGLVKAGQHHPLTDKDIQRLGNTYHAICNLFRDASTDRQRSYLDDVTNIRGYIARIRTMIENQIDAQDINYYYPHDTANKSMYHVMIDPAKILLKTTQQQYLFVDYPYWKTILNK